MIYFPNHTRRLMVMMRGLTISPGGAPTNGQKRNLSKKPPSVIADVRPSGSAGDSATARLWIFSFVYGAGVCLSRRACGAPRNERSEFWGLAGEPTCIRQAHARVPKDNITTENRRVYTEFCTKSKESLDLKQQIDNCFLQNNML